MKVLLINDTRDPKNLAYLLGQLKNGHYATVDAALPVEYLGEPLEISQDFIVLDFTNSNIKVSMAKKIAAEFPEKTILMVHNEYEQNELPNLHVMEGISEVADFIYNKSP